MIIIMNEYSALVVDDDVWMQRILAKTLQSFGFKNTYLASNGFEGIALAVEHTPLVIIMDILMPELSGHLALKILKHIKTTKNIPIMMVSALSDTENLSLAVKYGTAGYISKPFTRATVFEKLLNIFGADKLDAIAKGESISLDTDYFSEKSFNESNLGIFTNEYDSIIEPDDSMDFELKQSPMKPVLTPDQVMQHYQEDERRSIESIKKMLLKTKK